MINKMFADKIVFDQNLLKRKKRLSEIQGIYSGSLEV